jgi:hypothetical protein
MDFFEESPVYVNISYIKCALALSELKVEIHRHSLVSCMGSLWGFQSPV